MSKRIINSPNAPQPLGPYNHAVEVTGGRTLYLSGQIGLDPETGQIVTGGVEAQAERVLDNLAAVLAAADMSFENVVKCGIYLDNLDDFVTVNGIYGQRFDEATAPARATVQVARLPAGALVEIDAVAVAD